MRMLVIQGALNPLRVDQLKRDLPDIDIAVNSLPEDGVAIFDQGKFNQWDWPVEAAKTPDVTDTGRMNLTTLEGPDYTNSALQWIKEGILIQPPEEATLEGPER